MESKAIASRRITFMVTALLLTGTPIFTVDETVSTCGGSCGGMLAHTSFHRSRVLNLVSSSQLHGLRQRLCSPAGWMLLSALLATPIALTQSTLSLGSEALPEGRVGQSYTGAVTASGGSAPYTFSLAGGTLPMGISLNSDGSLRGMPTTAGQYSIQVQVADATNAAIVGMQTLRIASVSGLSINSAAISNATLGQTFEFAASAIGGQSPYSWDIVPGSGALPAGMSFASTGRLTGTPTQAGLFPLVMRVTDALAESFTIAVTLRVDSPVLQIATTSLRGAATGAGYAQNLTAVGGAPPYAWRLVSGTLPAGMTLTPSGTLSGWATSAGAASFVLGVTDALGASAQRNYTLEVSAANLRLVIPELPDAFTTQGYTVSFSASGGTAPYAYALASGTLPAGMTLSANGTLTGSPTAAGYFPVTLRVTDAATPPLSATAEIAVNVNSNGFRITTPTVPSAQRDTAFSLQLSSSGGTAPITFNLASGSLPAGITLSPAGLLAGTPTSAGQSSVVVRATDSAGLSAQLPLTLRVVEAMNGLGLAPIALPNATVGSVYTSTLQAMGGTSPRRFALSSGTLPPGLTLADNGNLSGVPSAAGLYTLNLRVTDGGNATANRRLTLLVSTPAGLNVQTLGLSSARVGEAYTGQLRAAGTGSGIAMLVVEGSLPAGITLSSGGMLSGTPSAAGAFPFAVDITDGTSASARASYVLNVNAASAPVLAPLQLPDAQRGAAYTATLTATGTTGPYSFALGEGALPAGISMNASGAFSGMVMEEGAYPFTVLVTDSARVVSQFGYVLRAGASGLAITTSSLPAATTTADYTAALEARGGTAPYTFALVTGTIPAGITLGTDGRFAGRATANGSFPLTIRVTDAASATATAELTLTVGTVSTGPLQFSIQSFPQGRVNTAYTSQVRTLGGTAPVTFTTSNGSLPAGLTLAANGNITGTPTSEGRSVFTIRATDAANTSISQEFSITISSGVSNSFQFTTTTLPNATPGTAYTASIATSGGTAPVAMTVSAGSLPAGLTLASSGAITGTATAEGQSRFTVRATDAANASITQEFSITVGMSTPGAFRFTTTTLANGAVGTAYTANLATSGGTAPITMTVTAGTLPVGLTLASSGAITGTPTTEGTSRFTVRASDAANASVTQEFSVVITAAAPGGFRITTTTLTNAVRNTPYTANLSSSGGTAPVTFSLIAGLLPEGLTMNLNGAISGTATTLGTSRFTVRATDASAATATAELSLTVSATAGSTPQFTTTTLPNGTTGTAYSATLAASGGTAPLTFSISTGTLPTGLTLATTGAISGTPTAAGNSRFTARVMDAANASSTQEFTITISGGSGGGVTVSSIANAASYQSGGIAPGEIVVIRGTGMGPQNLTTFSLTNNNVPTTLSGTRVLFNNTPAPVLYTSATQVSAIAPFGLTSGGTVTVSVEYQGTASTAQSLTAAAARPGIFTVDASGTGAAVALNQNGAVNSSTTPADAASTVTLYLAGGGLTNPPLTDGQVNSQQAPLAATVTATVNGMAATISYAGNAPGLVPGVTQVNLRLPTGTITGANRVVLRVGSAEASGNVTVYVR
jgi:uncharacterized protein (TIGR03437 family)